MAPIPPPDIVERHNQIHPSLGTDIIKNFNEEVHHRRSVEMEQLAQNRLQLETQRDIVLKETNRRNITMYVVLTFIATALALGGWLIYVGSDCRETARFEAGKTQIERGVVPLR